MVANCLHLPVFPKLGERTLADVSLLTQSSAFRCGSCYQNLAHSQCHDTAEQYECRTPFEMGVLLICMGVNELWPTRLNQATSSSYFVKMISLHNVNSNLRICGIQEKRSILALKVDKLTEGGFILQCAPGFKRSLMLLTGINYCSVWTAWIKLFTSQGNIAKLLELTCFLFAGIPRGIWLESSRIKQVKGNLVGTNFIT